MAAKRRRAPGGGRKPKGEFVGKSATITTRIRPDTRDELETAARTNGRSLSQEAELRLRANLRPTDAQRRNRALGHAITLLAESIEKPTGRSWLEDPFTGRALRYAIEHFAFYFAAISTDGTVEVPPGIKEEASKMPDLFAEQFRQPAGFGHTRAHFLIAELESAARLLAGVPPNESDMPFFSLADGPMLFSAHETVLGNLGRDMGLAVKKSREK